jgi:hypothetical protein
MKIAGFQELPVRRGAGAKFRSTQRHSRTGAGDSRMPAEFPQPRVFLMLRLVFPNFGRGFDSHRPLQNSAKFTLIRLPLLTQRLSICAHLTGVLLPFCSQVSIGNIKRREQRNPAMEASPRRYPAGTRHSSARSKVFLKVTSDSPPILGGEE